MKASIKFREEKNPLMRAKVPISVLGLPITSGLAVGDMEELRLDLATAFDSGPSFRVSYRPTDPRRPFSFVLKTGVGPLGSPLGGAPLAMTTEFSPVGRGGAGPSFSVLFKPRFGDFTITKSVRSSSSPAAHGTTTNGEGVSNNRIEALPMVGFQPFENGTNSNSGSGTKANGEFSADDRSGGVGGIGRLFSGMEVMARSVLPLWNQTALKLRWGLRVPPELRTVLTDDGRGGAPMTGTGTGTPLSNLPLLVLNKISIERKEKASEAYPAPSDATEEVKRQLEVLQEEHGSLRKSLENLHPKFIDRKTAPCRPFRIADIDTVYPPLPAGSGNWDRQGNRKSRENSAKDQGRGEMSRNRF